MAEDTEYIKLPLDERCVHKLWKARVHGYEEAATYFRRIDDEKSAEWNKYLGLIKKFVSDSNVAAQEKGLEASLAYIENAFVAGKTVGEVMPIVITKCIGTTKVRTKELAVQICLMYIEIEKQDVVLEELLKGTGNKNPKIAAASVTTITQALREFGIQVLSIKLILEKLPTLLEDRDKNVRDESKVLAVELFKWIGPVLKTKLSSLKPIQLQELESEFEKVKDEKSSVERYQKSQQSKKSKETGNAVCDDDDNITVSDDDAPNEVDPLDFVQPVEVLSKLPKDFYDKLESKKWQERKESLDCLEQLLMNAPKLESAEYGDLVRAIKRVITKDSNVVLVGIAAKCMALLAQGLKKKFQPYSSQCLSPLLEKFKEKKQNVVLPLRDAVDAIYDSTILEAVHEDIVALMGSKNPAVKAETITFLTRCFTKCTSQVLNKKLMKSFATALLKTLNESDPSVRDHSAEALGTAWKVVGEIAISPLLGDVDSIKMAKIKEASKTAVILAKPPKVVKKPKPTVEMCEKPVNEKSKEKASSKPARKPVKKTATFVVRSSSSISLGAAKPRVSDIEEFLDTGCEQGERLDISSKITQSLVEELSDKDWKIRTEAVNKLQEIISEAKLITNNLGDVVPAISERLADSNAKLVSSTVALCESIAVAMGPACRIYIRDFFPGMLQRLSDHKNYVRSTAIQCINTWGDTAGYKDFFEGEMIASALKTGSPTLRSELWTWLAEKLPEIQTVPKDELMACLPHLYTNLEDRNADVRKSANEVVYGFMMHLGYQAMLNACEKLKPASVNNIKGMLEKMRANIPETTAPPKGPKAVSAPISVASSQTSVKTKSTGAAKNKSAAPITQKKREEDTDLTPLLKVNNLKMQRNLDENKLKVLKWNFSTPREEFIEQLRDQMTTAGVNKTLIVNMFHHDFKYHLKAIDSLNDDLANNSAALVANFDLILKWLTIRFFDTNPSVISRGLEYLNSAFRVLTDGGYHMMELEASSFLPYLVLKTGDPKDTVRSHVKDIFDAIGSVYPISKLFMYIMDGLKSKNARQRTGCLELLGRLIENYGLSVCQPSPAAALKEIAKQISDRDNAVRNAALNCVVVAYFITGEKIRQMIGQISDKDMDLLEERIKRASKSRPPTVAAAQAKPAPQSSAETTDSVAELPSLQIRGTRGHLGRDEEIDAETHAEQDAASLPVPLVLATDNEQRYKHFGLDQKVIDAIEATAIVHPKPNLVEYDQTYLLETVTPITRTRPVTSTSDSSDTLTVDDRRSFSIEPKNLEEWITGLGTWTSEDDVIKAIQNIELVFVVEDKKEDLSGMETYLISQTINQLSHLSGVVDPGSFKCYRHLFSLLMKFFAHIEYSALISDYQLQQLLTQLTNLLVEKRSEYKENWNWFQKVVNNLVLKILECSEHTAVICALLRILYDCVASTKPNAEQHHQELIMKCIWKIVKYIPDWDTDLAYDKVLAEINRFLNDFPPSWWKKQPLDTPLRTYKTIVHAMVSFRGAEIMTIANGVSGFNQQSELFHYIDKLLRHMKSDAKPNSAPDREICESEVQKENLIPVLQVPKILEKISNQEESQKGLRMLYEFQKSHPEVDIEKFLTKSTKYFKQYVYNGLEALRNEKEATAIVDKCVESEGNDHESANGERGSGRSPKSDTQRYQQILKMLNGKNERLEAVSSLNPVPPAIPTPQKPYRDSENEGTTLEQLRQKLGQLKRNN